MWPIHTRRAFLHPEGSHLATPLAYGEKEGIPLQGGTQFPKGSRYGHSSSRLLRGVTPGLCCRRQGALRMLRRAAVRGTINKKSPLLLSPGVRQDKMSGLALRMHIVVVSACPRCRPVPEGKNVRPLPQQPDHFLEVTLRQRLCTCKNKSKLRWQRYSASCCNKSVCNKWSIAA